MNWIAQISANLLRDDELVDLIAASGGRWVFIGMESVDTTNLAIANKSFNKPDEYKGCWSGSPSATSTRSLFIFGLDNDTPGAADRTSSRFAVGLPDFLFWNADTIPLDTAL
jgi:hypothetical protein